MIFNKESNSSFLCSINEASIIVFLNSSIKQYTLFPLAISKLKIFTFNIIHVILTLEAHIV